MDNELLTDEEIAAEERDHAEYKEMQSLGRAWTHGRITNIELAVWVMPAPVESIVSVRVKRQGDPFGYRKWYPQPTEASKRRVLRAIAKLAGVN